MKRARLLHFTAHRCGRALEVFHIHDAPSVVNANLSLKDAIIFKMHNLKGRVEITTVVQPSKLALRKALKYVNFWA